LTRTYIDNLFNSHPLFGTLYQVEALVHGVARTNGCGLPFSVIQKEEKNLAQDELRWGTTKAARMKDCRECPDLLAASVYDTKPVHLLLTALNCVEWNVTQKISVEWEGKVKSFVKFLRLNMIDKNNHNMNSVDMADQLQGVYRPDHWMRNRKWWRAIWIWRIRVAGTNVYKLYEVMYEEEIKKQEPKNVLPRWTHACFLEKLVSNLMFPEETAKHLATLNREDVVAELILMVNPLYHIMSVPMLNYDWYLALRSVLSTSWV
jgi:hypothetical protein